jgi:hypothetical protein
MVTIFYFVIQLRDLATHVLAGYQRLNHWLRRSLGFIFQLTFQGLNDRYFAYWSPIEINFVWRLTALYPPIPLAHERPQNFIVAPLSYKVLINWLAIWGVLYFLVLDRSQSFLTDLLVEEISSYEIRFESVLALHPFTDRVNDYFFFKPISVFPWL